MVNYSSCYATSRVCTAKRKSLGKWREKASAEELQGPSLHSAPGYFYAFYFPFNELFTFFSFPGATIICACPCVTRCTGQKTRRRVGGHWNVPTILILFDFNYCFFFVLMWGIFLLHYKNDDCQLLEKNVFLQFWYIVCKHDLQCHHVYLAHPWIPVSHKETVPKNEGPVCLL